MSDGKCHLGKECLTVGVTVLGRFPRHTIPVAASCSCKQVDGDQQQTILGTVNCGELVLCDGYSVDVEASTASPSTNMNC